jgi:dihydroxy-acid dehydratase
VGPEAAAGGPIALVKDGDIISIDADAGTIELAVARDVLDARQAAQAAKGFKPAAPRSRKVSSALKAYAAFTTSAARGAVRDVSRFS